MNQTKNEELQAFDVEISERLSKTVSVKAKTREEAEEMVETAWKNEVYVLEPDDFADVEFTAAPQSREREIDEAEQQYGEEYFSDFYNPADYYYMDDISDTPESPALKDTPQTPINENPYVTELIEILDKYGRSVSELTALVDRVNDMERLVSRAEDYVVKMKAQLDEMKETQNSPVKTALRNTIKILESKLAEIKTHIAKVKDNIVNGCKNAVNAFNNKGISALNNLAAYFNVKDNLLNIKNDINTAIQADDKALNKINAITNEYHTAVRAVKNIARLLIGKPHIERNKEAGAFAKAVSAPYNAHKTVMTGMYKSVNRAVAGIEKLETAVKRQAELKTNSKTAKQQERAEDKKPSALDRLRENIAVIEQTKREAPAVQRPKHKGVEI